MYSIRISLSIRVSSTAVPYTARLFVNGAPSALVSVIVDGSLFPYGNVAVGNLQLFPLDLVTVLVTFSAPPLPFGVCATLVTYYNGP